MKTKLHYVFSISIVLIVFSVHGQQITWKNVKEVSNTKTVTELHLDGTKVHYFKLDLLSFHQRGVFDLLRCNCQH